jgi:signal transduction histidine kinase
MIIVFRDITERRKAEERDRQLQKTNALTLMAVGLSGDLAESQRQMDDLLKQAISKSNGSALRLLGDAYARSGYQQSIVQQLVRLGQTDRGEAVPLDLNEVLSGLAEEFKKNLGKGRSLKMTLSPGLPPIKVDAAELRKNLMRLVVCARHATPDGGSVEMSTTKRKSPNDGSSVGLELRDTGKGIRPGATESVFDPYYQSRPGKRSPGFSLALVYQFVTLSGGHIEVSAKAGEGGYLLTFPAAAETACAGTA